MASEDNPVADPWEKAKNTWSKFVRLQEPTMLSDPAAIKEVGMERDIARFGLASLHVEVNMVEMKAAGLLPFLDIVLAHEVGHHVLAPGNLLVDAKLVSYISDMFPG